MTITPPVTIRTTRAMVIGVGFTGIVAALFTPSPRLILFGATTGSLYGLAAAGVVLVHRTHRILNLAAVIIGSVPAVIVTLLQVSNDLPYIPALLLSVIGGAALGALVDVVVIRRFEHAPRVIVTIATIAVVQVLALVGERVAARLISDRDVPSTVPTPWDGRVWLDGDGRPILTGDHVAAVAAVAVTVAGLWWFLRSSRTGVSLRAVAENVERARLLGIPVRRVQTTAWAIAGLVAAVAVGFWIPLVGVPLDPTLGHDVTLAVIAAAVIARLESIPVAFAAGVGIGVLEQAALTEVGSGDLTSVLVLAVVLVALFAPRSSRRADTDDQGGSWQTVTEPRVVPRRIRQLRRVRSARGAVLGLCVAASVVAPFVVTDGGLVKLTLIPLTAIVGVSLVVLTGWAGQVSLGQFAFAGVGAGIAGGLAANHASDFFIAVPAGVAAGVVIAVVVGLPTARLTGTSFAVATLALAAAAESYGLVRGYPLHRIFLPHGEAPRVERPVLYGVLDLRQDRTFYFVVVVLLAVTVWLARTFRHSRSGRVVIAARDNPAAAAALGVDVARARLAAFAVSGGLAALGGALLAYHQGSVDAGTYGVAPSLQLFLMVVLGGITSPMGAVLGAVVMKSVQYFVEPHFTSASLLFEGPLLLIVLLLNPGGISAGFQRARDRFLTRAVAVARA